LPPQRVVWSIAALRGGRFHWVCAEAAKGSIRGGGMADRDRRGVAGERIGDSHHISAGNG
jgi:hypothetical protein